MTPPWQARRVLVTGATGMVGSWLVKELVDRGTSVVALVRDADPQSELIRSGAIRQIAVVSGALEEPQTVERAVYEYAVDTVFHLGAQAIVGIGQRAPLATFESNIRGTYHVLEACRRYRDLVRQVVVASSDKAYGEQPRLPYTEEMPLNGRHPYEVSKSCADLIAQSYAQTYGLPVAIARCGNIFGGGDLNWSRIVPGTIRACVNGERAIIRSDGTYVRDYFYVKDAALAYLRLAEALEDPEIHGQAFNFSTEQPLTVLKLVALIQTLMGCAHRAPEIRNEASGEIREQYLSAAKARALLGWQPQCDVEAGLRETIAWYRASLAGQVGAVSAPG